MRLWSIHPKYLDRIGLVALWRESLLAQKVLRGETKGYKSHPQLKRFRKHPAPVNAIVSYLIEVWKESKSRGHSFNKKKISKRRARKKIPVTPTELKEEFDWLYAKLLKFAEVMAMTNVGRGFPNPRPVGVQGEGTLNQPAIIYA